jgi:uncharacterized protein
VVCQGHRGWCPEVIRTYWLAGLVTVAIWGAIFIGLGGAGLVTVAILTVLEVTFSFDNAVVNATLLQRMSRWWQGLFMTLGILVAVFGIRFALPIGIVALSAHHGFVDILSLAMHHPYQYAAALSSAQPLIDAFGGTFLAMIALSFFLDEAKGSHWIAPVEQRLAPLGRFDNLGIFSMLLAAILVSATAHDQNGAVLLAALCGVVLHVGLDLFSTIADGKDAGRRAHHAKVLVGVAAFIMFLRLEVLDASFSFDGVIGAFAITTSVVLIMAGLGVGAVWVRSMTVHLVRAGTLARYQYLEHGAHWTIAALALVMFAKLYGIDPPIWVTGSFGLAFIGAAALSSVRERRREQVGRN